MKITKEQITEIIKECLSEAEVSGMGMGSGGGRPGQAAPATPSRRFDSRSAEAFMAKYGYDLDKIAALQNDERFMSNPATRAQFAEFNDYAAVNLPREWKAKWQAAVKKADAAARSELNPSMVKNIAGKVANKVSNMFGGRKVSNQTLSEIEKIVGDVLTENKKIALENKKAQEKIVKMLNEKYNVKK